MKVTVSCHAIMGSSLHPGIPGVWQNPNGQVEHPFARVGYHTDTDTAVRQADICWRDNHLPARQGVLVAIFPARLKLPWEPIAPDLNFWAGGECPKRPGAVSNNCKGLPRAKWPRDRYELFLLFEGESMVVCDSATRVGIITVDNGSPCLLSPTAQAMMDYIAGVGLRSDSHRGVTWAIKNIETIAQAHPTVRADTQLGELRQKLREISRGNRVRA